MLVLLKIIQAHLCLERVLLENYTLVAIWIYTVLKIDYCEEKPNPDQWIF